METISTTDLAQRWFRSELNPFSEDPSHNKLFEMLYNTYSRRHGIEKNFAGLSYENGDHHDACAMLYRWYADHYRSKPTGSQGQKRSVNLHSDGYTFDLLYSDDRQFKNYLLSPLPWSGSQDLLAFVLHTAVAFLVPLDELDRVLQHLGFHPLHVKNIHHLAIAYVLLMNEKQAADDGFDPFAEVRRLYFRALELLEEADIPETEAYSFDDLETRILRSRLLQDKGLASLNFETLIAHNRRALNMRHSLILSDFHRLSAVFIHIFDSSADPEAFEYSEEAYSFYRFVQSFCKEDLSRKKFREQLTSMIDLKQKHPTRNVLILLWLYTYCFAFLPGINIDKTAFRRITRQLKKTNPDWEKEAKLYYQDDLFDVYGFLTKQPDRSVPQTFRGADFFAFINEKLLLRYGWGPLNEKLPFDRYIHSLQGLTIRIDYTGFQQASFETLNAMGEAESFRVVELAADVDNVPVPLTSITRIFEELAVLHAEKAARSKYVKLSPCPLKCGLYEQL